MARYNLPSLCIVCSYIVSECIQMKYFAQCSFWCSHEFHLIIMRYAAQMSLIWVHREYNQTKDHCPADKLVQDISQNIYANIQPCACGLSLSLSSFSVKTESKSNWFYGKIQHKCTWQMQTVLFFLLLLFLGEINASEGYGCMFSSCSISANCVAYSLGSRNTCIINKSSPADMCSHGSATALKQVSVA